MTKLQIGGVHIDRQAPLELARHYLSQRQGWAYPAYDGFDTARANGPLGDSDLLAPVLLNIQHLSITTYQQLQDVRPRLQELLDRIPLEQSLVDTDDDDLEILGELFGVVDNHGIKGAKGAVISKVLHRKRPAFIPLYDRQVGAVYLDGAEAPVPRAKKRSWRAFAPLFAAAVRTDLQRELPFWQEIAALATDPPITPLRALDVVAWSVGRKLSAATSSS
jgi:Family of unknown function (DUF6308)